MVLRGNNTLIKPCCEQDPTLNSLGKVNIFTTVTTPERLIDSSDKSVDAK
jgi:hypothetical protein